MQADERYDEILVNLAGQIGGIEPLFDTLFSFLYRKTDYFHVMKPGDKIGFPAGKAQQLLLNSFSKFERFAAETARRAEAAAAKQKPSTGAAPKKTEKEKANPGAAMPKTASQPEPAIVEISDEAAGPADASTAMATDGYSSPAASAAAGVKAAVTPHEKGVEMAAKAGAKSASHLVEQVGVPYNGGQTDKYYWEQTLNDVTIHAPVPPETKARDVVCVIGRGHVSLKLKGSDEAIIDADYPCDARNGQEIWERVKHGDSYWNIGEAHDVRCVSIYLDKERESWWKSAVHGAEEIDTTKVDSTRDMYDYDPETQGHIRKIMFDQHQKRLGKPTSDDLKNEDMLRKAWDAEGSPFKGTPFDPSKINMGGAEGGGPAM